MMKKRILSLAVTAGLVGAASSALAEMHINPNGLGEALVYPFYSAANGNDTYIHVVNTTEDVKAVKVRFIESQNSQEVLDFNLYLSPEDAWAGVITANPNGAGAMIRTADNSCSVPRLGEAGLSPFQGVITNQGSKVIRDQPFVNYKYDIAGENDRSVERTLEGYVEIIEMGQIESGPAALGRFAVHGVNKLPNNCAALVAAWTGGGAWNALINDDFLVWDANSTAGGLYGYGVVINVEQGTAVGYDAVAIDNFVDPILTSHLHFPPGDEQPSLANAQELATLFDGAAATTYDFGTAPVAHADAGAAAVSALMMSTAIANDYVVDPDINAKTDWVVTFPTKRFFVDLGAPVTDPANPPFARRWNPATSNACEPIQLQVWDREEAVIAPSGPIFSPPPPGGSADEQLCKEVNILSFGSGSALNASTRILREFTPPYNEGWAAIDFSTGGLATPLPTDAATATLGGPRQLVGDDGIGEVQLIGLPVVGFGVFSYQNGELPGGVLANYSAGSNHKSQVVIQAYP